MPGQEVLLYPYTWLEGAGASATGFDGHDGGDVLIRHGALYIGLAQPAGLARGEKSRISKAFASIWVL